MSPSAEHFLDQLVVWRELAFNTCEYVPDYASYASLPEWSRATLAAHRRDKRPHLYTLEQLAAARTADPVWNAAMRQLLVEGWFHGYLRMLWGKKILEWSKTPEEALERMQILMDRYSLDGRDPNSYAGYAWVLGRYDRPWPERRDLRHGALHDVSQRRAQAQNEAVSRDLRGGGATGGPLRRTCLGRGAWCLSARGAGCEVPGATCPGATCDGGRSDVRLRERVDRGTSALRTQHRAPGTSHPAPRTPHVEHPGTRHKAPSTFTSSIPPPATPR